MESLISPYPSTSTFLNNPGTPPQVFLFYGRFLAKCCSNWRHYPQRYFDNISGSSTHPQNPAILASPIFIRACALVICSSSASSKFVLEYLDRGYTISSVFWVETGRVISAACRLRRRNTFVLCVTRRVHSHVRSKLVRENTAREEGRQWKFIGSIFQFISIAELLLEECSAPENVRGSHSSSLFS
jgi:hypothetical protein